MIGREFICGAASTSSRCVAWLSDDCIAYSAANLVLLARLDTERSGQGEVLRSLKAQRGRVNCLAKVVSAEAWLLVTGSDDGVVVLWRRSTRDPLHEWQELARVETRSPVMIVCAEMCADDEVVLVVSDASGAVRAYSAHAQRSGDLSTVLSAFKLGTSQMPNELHLLHLRPNDSSSVCLLVGSVDGHIYMYTLDAAQGERAFTLVGGLGGHEDWVTCINSFHCREESALYFASGSQDSKIRLWRVSSEALDSTAAGNALVSGVEVEVSDNLDEDDVMEGEEIQPSRAEEEATGEARLAFVSSGCRHRVFLEALLLGHEDWVTSVHWLWGGDAETEMTLFSTSMDRNMIVWRADADTGIWVPLSRMGDVGGALGGSVGGNLLGFVGGVVAPSAPMALGVGYGGSFHLWLKEGGRWGPVPLLSGHFDTVNDVVWSSAGDFVVSVSADQTCRLFAKQKTNGRWCEMSRPQIHGFNLNCMALSPDNCTLYSGSDEKLIRIFEAPSVVLAGLEKLAGILTTDTLDGRGSRIHSAYIPELGLSNKASSLMSSAEATEMGMGGVAGITWTAPPLEGQLADFTIWPEVRKLYGHTNDVQCMALSASGRLLASACKAREREQAAVILWDTHTFLSVGSLEGHESTVACLSFSPDDRFLASAGRDRTLCVFSIAAEDTGFSASAVAVVLKAHKRIVWDCSWSPNSACLVTASRDGQCKLWRVDSSSCAQVFEFTPFASVSVTAIHVHPLVQDRLLVAAGSEEGDLHVWECSVLGQEVDGRCVAQVPPALSHGRAVRRVKWRRALGDDLLLASCGDDHTVRVLTYSPSFSSPSSC